MAVPDDDRKALGLDDGDALVMEIHGDELRIRPALSAFQRVQERLKPYRIPGRLASDELIADRRAEVAREDAEEADWIKSRLVSALGFSVDGVR